MCNSQKVDGECSVERTCIALTIQPFQGCFQCQKTFLRLQASVKPEHCLTVLQRPHSCLLGDGITVRPQGWAMTT